MGGGEVTNECPKHFGYERTEKCELCLADQLKSVEVILRHIYADERLRWQHGEYCEWAHERKCRCAMAELRAYAESQGWKP
jgi:hypothetical protein